MLLVQVKFVFPFKLSLPRAGFWVRYQGRPYHVCVFNTDGLKSYTYTGQQEGQDPNKEKGGHFLVDVGFHDGKKEKHREGFFIDNDPYLFLRKIIDYVGYTFLHVTFEVSPPSPEGDEQRQKDFTKTALKVAGQFINVYRELAGDPDISSPSEYDSPGIEICVSTGGYVFEEDGYVNGQFRLLSRTVQWDSLEKTGREKPILLTQEQLDNLSQRLKEDTGFPLYTELLLNGKEYAFLHRNCRMSVVAVQSAFEVFLQRRLLDEYSIRGISEITVRQDGGSVKKPVEEVIPSASVRELLETYWKKLCGKSVKANQKYQRWHKEAYERRNQIIHSGRLEVSESDARNAFEATLEYMNYLEKALKLGSA